MQVARSGAAPSIVGSLPRIIAGELVVAVPRLLILNLSPVVGGIELQERHGQAEAVREEGEFSDGFGAPTKCPDAGGQRYRALRSGVLRRRPHGHDGPVGNRHARLNEHAAFVGARAGSAPQREAVSRNHHGRSGVGEFDPLARDRKKGNSVSVGHMAKEVASYLLTADLVPIVVDRHQQEGGEGIGLFFTMLLRVLPAVGLQWKALEVEIVRELAIAVVLCGQRAPVQQVVPELMSEREALASAVAGLSVVENLPTGLLAPCPERPSAAYIAALSTTTLIVSLAHASVVSQSTVQERKDTNMEATKVCAFCINQMELAARWRISHRTLERWRWIGEGPKFLKVGGRVVYRLADIEEYETSLVRTCTSDKGPREAIDGV